MTALYSDLPLQPYTLQSFVDYADLVRGQKGPQEFIRFVLTGEIPGEHQAVIDPIHNALEDDYPLSQARDYDSLLGITQDIVVDCAISVYPVPNPVDTLTTSIHATYDIVRGNVSCFYFSTV